MFGFNFMDKLYPVKDFLGNLIPILNLDPNTYKLEELIETMKKTEQCEINNTSMQLDLINNKLQNKYNFLIKNLTFGKIYFKFPKTYLVNNTIIRMNDICIDLEKNNLKNKEEEKNENVKVINKEEESSSNFLSAFGTLINLVAVHIVIELSNIKLRIFDGENCLFNLMITKLTYDSTKDAKPIEMKDKAKYLFLHNKTITLGKIFAKFGYDDNDENFFNNEIVNKVKFYTDKKTILISNDEVHFNIIHNFEKEELLIENDIKINIFLELILYKEQLFQLINILQIFTSKNQILIHEKKEEKEVKKEEIKEENEVKKEEIKEENEIKTDLKKDYIDILGYKLFKINYNFNISNIYLILVDNDKIEKNDKPKFWMIYQKYFNKYYDISSGDKGGLKIFHKHFCYFENSFYYLYLNNVCISCDICQKDKQKIKIIVKSNDTSLRLIIPNKIENKRNTIIINNVFSKENDTQNEEKTFNELFIDNYTKVVKFGFFMHEIIVIRNLSIMNLKVIFDTLNIELNALIIYKIKKIIKLLLDSLNKENENIQIPNQEIPLNNNENIIEDNKLSNKIEIYGDVNIRCFTNKRSLKYINYLRNNVSKEIDNDYYPENLTLHIIGLNIIYNLSSNRLIVNYQNSMFFYFMGLIAYPFLVHYQDNSINFEKNSLQANLQKKLIDIDLNSFKPKIYLSQIFFYFNPFLLENLKKYVYLFINSFKCFSLEKQLLKDAEIINDNINSIQKKNNNILQNIFLSIDEINIIIFGNLSLKNTRIDFKKFGTRNELLFKLILNPLLKLKIFKISFNKLILEIDNILLAIHKNDNTFQNELLTYQTFVNDQSNKNFDIILYKANSNKKLCSTLIELNSKKIESKFSEIVFCPISKNLDEILIICEHAKKEYIKMCAFIFSHYPQTNETLDLANYEKEFPSEIIENDNNLNKISNKNINNEIIINISFDKIFIDLFSTYTSNNTSISTNILNPLKNKMRLITEISNISFNFEKDKNLKLTLGGITSIFLKDLGIHPNCISHVINNFSIISDKKHSFFTKIGFAEIISSKKPINIEIYFDNSKMNLFIITELTFHFCSDSLKYSISFINTLKTDYSSIKNLFSIFDDDTETIITDAGMLQEKLLKEQLKYREMEGGIEYRSVGKAYSDNGNLYSRIAKMVNTAPSINTINSKDKEKKIKIIKEENRNIDDVKKQIILTYNFSFNIDVIKIYLYNGEDFNFQGKYILQSDEEENKNNNENNNLEDVVSIPITTQENINPRDNDNNIVFNLSNVNFVLSHSKNSDKLFSIILSLTSFIIEDNLQRSKYKKVLSQYNFDQPGNLLLSTKINIIQAPNGNGESDIDAIFDISPIAIYLDQVTLEFLFNFFYSLDNLISLSKNNNIIINNNDNNVNNITNININENHELTDNEISAMNYSIYDNNIFNLQMSFNPNSFYLTKFVINPFFISFNYTAREFTGNQIPQDIKKILDYLNLVSLTDLKINFKYYDNNKERIKVKRVPETLYQYYKDDIIQNQIYGNYIESLPFINGLCKLIEGFLDMTSMPVYNYKNGLSVQEGVVNGVRSFVVNSSNTILNFGEACSGFFRKVFCGSNEGTSIYRELKYKIDERCKKVDEYYLK